MSGTSIVEYSTDVSRQTLLGSTFQERTHLYYRCASIERTKCSGVVELRTKKFSQFDLPW